MQTIEKNRAKGNVTNEQQPSATQTEAERVERWVAWVKANQRRLTIVSGALVVVAGGVWFAVSARQRRETFALRELSQARASAEAGNLPLAASDLSRVVSTYGGTRAGQEAVLLLAQVRLLQGQSELAVTELEQFLAAGPRQEFRAQAQGALGAALEQVGQFASAGRAYETGASVSEYKLLSSQFLMDAGRAFTLGADSASAIRVYQRILADHADTPAATEARVRLAELGRYDEPAGT